MLIQFVQFETRLPENDVLAVANERLPQFQALPGLRQKHYLKLNAPDSYGGFYMWDSAADMAAFRDSDLARTIPGDYGIVGKPRIDIHELLFSLRD